jgi:tRNA-dihydrouridine synthase
MIISGGLDTAESARRAYEESGADAVMIARGALGNPWIFEQLTGEASGDPPRERIVDELLWIVDRAEEHLGPERAARYLRKFYPWYLEHLDASSELAAALQSSDELDSARRLIGGLAPAPAAA